MKPSNLLARSCNFSGRKLFSLILGAAPYVKHQERNAQEKRWERIREKRRGREEHNNNEVI